MDGAEAVIGGNPGQGLFQFHLGATQLLASVCVPDIEWGQAVTVTPVDCRQVPIASTLVVAVVDNCSQEAEDADDLPNVIPMLIRKMCRGLPLRQVSGPVSKTTSP